MWEKKQQNQAALALHEVGTPYGTRADAGEDGSAQPDRAKQAEEEKTDHQAEGQQRHHSNQRRERHAARNSGNQRGLRHARGTIEQPITEDNRQRHQPAQAEQQQQQAQEQEHRHED